MLGWYVRCWVAAGAAACVGSLAGCRSARVAITEPGFESSALRKVTEEMVPALVRLDVVTSEPAAGRMRKENVNGSGAVITPEGHVITNHHVAGHATRITCRMSDGREVPGHLVGTDPLADIAVVRLDVNDLGGRVPVARFGDSDQVRVGDPVFAMGSPAALSQSVTAGIVSNTAMILPRWMSEAGDFELEGEDVGSLVRWIGHDAVIYPGNSGGPLVDRRGRIIGINEMGIASLGGAIPSNLAMQIAKEIMATGGVRRSWIGWECQPRLKTSPTSKGILIAGVIRDGPADRAILKSGDLLLTYDGVEVDGRLDEDMPVFNALVLATPVGKTVKVTVLRDGQVLERSLTTEPRDKARGDAQAVQGWGITARDFTRLSALEDRRPDTNGVWVETSRSGGPCDMAKPAIEPGDVIVSVDRQRIVCTSDLQAWTARRIEGRSDRVPVVVEFDRGPDRYMTVVRIGPGPSQETPRLSRKAWLPVRVQVLTRDLAQALGLEGREGVRVTQVMAGPQARDMGLKVGDLVLKINAEPIRASNPEDREVFAEMIRQHDIGTTVVLDVVRDGQPQSVTVTLREPLPDPAGLHRYEDDSFELTLRELGFEDKVDRQLDVETRAVWAEAVAPAGWAALGGLRPGDIVLSINGRATADVASAKEALTDAAKQRLKAVVFLVRRGIRWRFVEVEPDWAATSQR